jgi:alpha-mannosidase
MPVYARLVPGEGRLLPPARSLVASDSAHAVVDTVKPAEDGHGLIVRVYDCANRRGRVTLSFANLIASAQPVTILEEPDPAVELEIAEDTLRFDLLPFQVRSFRVVLRQPQG